MKIAGVLVELSRKKTLHMCERFVVPEHRKKVMHLNTPKAIHGMSESASLWHRKFRGDLEQIGFMFNAHDACMAKGSVNGKTHTMRFHVDDSMSGHAGKKVNDKFLTWSNKQCSKCGEVKATRGNEHN